MDMRKRERPIRITFLAIFALAFAAFYGLRVFDTVYYWKTLVEFGAKPVYILLSGLVWLALGLLLVWGLWDGKRWAWLTALAGAVFYVAWYWLDRLLLQHPHSNGTFALISSSVLLLLVLIILFTPRARNYFLEDTHAR